MAFRNAEDALRAKVDVLEREIGELRDAIQKLVRAQARLDRKQSPGRLDAATAEDARLAPCEHCGGDAFNFGDLVAQGLRFVPSDASFWERNISASTRMYARRCENCGGVVVFDTIE